MSREGYWWHSWKSVIVYNNEITDQNTLYNVLFLLKKHSVNYGNVKWSSWRLELPVNRVFVQQFVQTDKNKHQSPRCCPFVRDPPATGRFPAQRDSNAENVSIWWRHNILATIFVNPPGWNRNIPRNLGQYPGCFWHGSLNGQAISSHNICHSE